MPASSDKTRVTRSTLATRNKTLAKKNYTQKSKVDSVNSPGWVTGHPDLFKVPEFSPRKTRRSSVYQKAGSPSRYRNAKIPGSNCRKNRSQKTSSNSLPVRSGVVTRSRRSSSVYLNKASLLITVLPQEQDEPMMEKLPSNVQSLKSVKSSASSRTSVVSKDSKKKEEFSMFCPETFVEPPEGNFVLPEFSEEIPSSEECSEHFTSSPELVFERMCASRSKGSIRSEAHSASRRSSLRSISISGTDSGVLRTSIKSRKSVNSLAVKSVTSEESSCSKISLSPGKSVTSQREDRSHTSLSPNASEFVMIPCDSDTEILFNNSRHGIQTPSSRQSLKSPDIDHEAGHSSVSCPISTHQVSQPQSTHDFSSPSSRHLLTSPRHEVNSPVTHKISPALNQQSFTVSQNKETRSRSQSRNDVTLSQNRETRRRSQSRQASRPQSKHELSEMENSPFPSCSYSRDDASTPTSRHKLRTPQSKRFLEAIEDSPAPVATKSFHPPPKKMLILSLPAIANSEKAISCISENSEAPLLNTRNPFDVKSPSGQRSNRRISQVAVNTPAGSRRELTLKDISNSPERLDSTTAMETFQTPLTHNRTCAESETFYETPRVAMDTNDTLDSIEVTNLDQSSKLDDKSRRCIIL